MASTSYKLGKREKESNRRRVAILKAAGECFTVNGYQGATVDAIAQQASVSKGLVFHLFGNKQALFDAVINDALNQWTQLSDIRFREADGEVFKEIELYFLASFEFVEEHPVLSLFAQPTATGMTDHRKEFANRIRKWRLRVKRSISRGIEQGLIRKEVDPARMSDIVHELQQSLLIAAPIKNGAPKYDRKLLRQAISLLIHGLQT